MIRIIFFILLFASASQAKIKVTIEYSEAANYFDLMDNVSSWWDGFTEIEYSKEWQKRHGKFSDGDAQLFSQYKELRQKYYDDPDQIEKDPLKNRNGFFSTLSSMTADPIAEAFYSSLTMNEAFKKLDQKLSKEEIDFLKSFYDHFKSSAQPYLKESEAFRSILPKLRKSLSGKKLERYFSQVAAFYNVKSDLEYRIIYVWYPPIQRSNASPTGGFLVMRYNPLKDLKMAEADSDIVFHEIVHVISKRQSLEQKRALTDAFLGSCNVKDTLKKLTILEEPLAVILGQIIFLEKFNPSKLKMDESLYRNPWISVYAKLLSPIAKSFLIERRTINDNFIPVAAKVCNELVEASKKVTTGQTEIQK